MAIELIAVLSLFAAIGPGPATDPRPDPAAGAPSAPPDAKYCMRIDRPTGSLIEIVRCWTRQQWAEQGVDLDKQWPKEGVAIK
jgi:hypothetical protein